MLILTESRGVSTLPVIALLLVFAMVTFGFMRVAEGNDTAAQNAEQTNEWESINNNNLVYGENPQAPVRQDQNEPPKKLKASARQINENVEVRSQLPENLTGICHYKFINGNTRLEMRNTITNVDECYKSFPASQLLVGGEWTFTLEFEDRFDKNDLTKPPLRFFVTF
jgi:hypothetical protein